MHVLEHFWKKRESHIARARHGSTMRSRSHFFPVGFASREVSGFTLVVFVLSTWAACCKKLIVHLPKQLDPVASELWLVRVRV